MKNATLNSLYKCFYQWAQRERFCCDAGCAACCTQNVTITAQEGTRIVDFLRDKEQAPFIYAKIKALPSGPRPSQTTNEYVLTSMQNLASREEAPRREGPCPFLENNLCTIYPVRPFSCRCFASETLCTTDISAAVPEHYLYGSIVVMQLIEHLDQLQPWGNMTDMLLYLCSKKTDENFALQAQQNLLTAQPLPGFLVPEQYNQHVQPLLESIFVTQIGSKSIEMILNGQ